MKTITKQINLYKFEELEQSVKDEILSNWRIDDDFIDSDFILEDAREIAAMLGIDIDKIYYSGFHSQGDGACFTGYYSYKKGALDAIKKYTPTDSELHCIAEDLQSIQKPRFYGLSATISHSGHYYHEFCTNIDTHENDDGLDYVLGSLNEALRDFMRWIYKRLYEQYTYWNSEECITEEIECNDYTFLSNGEVYNEK